MGKSLNFATADKMLAVQELLGASLERDLFPSFDLAVGNPPYQVSRGENSSASSQVYPSFILLASAVSNASTLITPARWFNNQPQADFRKEIAESVDGDGNSHFREIIVYEDAALVFPTSIFIRGGISVLFIADEHMGKTTFVNGENSERITQELLTPDGTVDVERTVQHVREKIRLLSDRTVGEEKVAIDYHNKLLKAMTRSHGSSSRDCFVRHTTAEKTSTNTIKIRLTRDQWRWGSPADIILSVPENRVGMNFRQQVKGPGDDLTKVDSLNKLFVLLPGETAMSSVGFILEGIEQARAFHKYSQTALFSKLVQSRINSHHASPRVYADLPWFEFDETDPIDWSKTAEEINAELIALFELEDYAEWINLNAIPYVEELDGEQALRLRPSTPLDT